MNWQERTILLIGEEAVEKLAGSHVFIAGLGGVGGACAEALARAGIGEMSLADADVIQETNINRQLIANHTNIGEIKVEEWKKRLLSINPALRIHTCSVFLKKDTLPGVIQPGVDYIADAIDTLKPKFELISYAVEHHIPLITSLGSGGRLDPSRIMVSDISKSYGCKFGRKLRKKLYRHGIKKGFKAVFSPEEVDKRVLIPLNESNKKTVVGTISYMPLMFGYYMASEIIRDLIS